MPIIEGPDGAGKSTLAKSLADRLDMNILKMTADGGQSVPEYMRKLACDGVIIVLSPPLHVVIGRLNARGDEYADVVCPNITEIYRRYREWAEAHPYAIVLDDNDPATAMEEILKCML